MIGLATGRLWAVLGSAALVVLVLFGLYHHGVTTGRAEVQAVLDAERAAHRANLVEAERNYGWAAQESAERYAATMRETAQQHEETTNELKDALRASGLDRVRLGSQLARLHDRAAGTADPGPAAAPAAPSGEAAGTPAPAADASVAELLTTVNDNYAICLRNAAQLVELQDWYTGLAEKRP